jgi:DUF1680 family protein
VKGHAGKVAVTRGPLVYCLENVDNTHVEIFATQLDSSSLRDEYALICSVDALSVTAKYRMAKG